MASLPLKPALSWVSCLICSSILLSCGNYTGSPVALDPGVADVAALPGAADPIEALLGSSAPSTETGISLLTTQTLLGGLKRPYGLAFDGSNLVVAEFGFSLGSSGLRVVSPTGTQIAFLAAGQVGRLRGVAVDGSDYLALDGGFGAPGRLFRVSSSGGSPTLVADTLGVAVSVDVISPGVYAVTDLSNTGRLLRVQQGVPTVELATGLGFAYGVAVVDANTFVVSDPFNGTLLEIDISGGTPGGVTTLVNSGLSQPRGLKLISPGVFLVADFDLGILSVDTNVSPATIQVITGSGVGTPNDVAMIDADLIGVSDFTNNRLVLVDQELTAGVVDTDSDVSANDGVCSLREAIQANNLGSDFNDCADPMGTIAFDPGLNGSTILLSSALPEITADVEIDGPGATNLTVDGNGNYRVFDIDGGLTVTIEGLTITNGQTPNTGGTNDINQYGGGILADFGTDLTVRNSTLTGNTAVENGGGIAADTLTVENSSFSSNSAGNYGGGLAATSATVTESSFSGNTAYRGGGIGSDTAMVSNSTLTGNAANGIGPGVFGGGIYANVTATVNNSVLTGNFAVAAGGGIAAGEMTLSFSSLSGNGAGIYGGGAAVFNYATVSYSTFSSNTVSAGSGGGLVTYQGGNVSNSSFGNNFAGTDGGGIFAPIFVNVYNSTISRNTAGVNGGGARSNSLAVINSIVSGNVSLSGSPNRECYGGFGSYSLFGFGGDPGGCPSSGTGVIVPSGPLADIVDPIGNNGGFVPGVTGSTDPIQTFSLPSGSPAIDAGDPAFTSPPDFDQRGSGFPRVNNGRIDIGSFESP